MIVYCWVFEDFSYHSGISGEGRQSWSQIVDFWGCHIPTFRDGISTENETQQPELSTSLLI